jgi:hypothetical protein
MTIYIDRERYNINSRGDVPYPVTGQQLKNIAGIGSEWEVYTLVKSIPVVVDNDATYLTQPGTSFFTRIRR